MVRANLVIKTKKMRIPVGMIRNLIFHLIALKIIGIRFYRSFNIAFKVQGKNFGFHASVSKEFDF